jgi:hypothetical protein
VRGGNEQIRIPDPESLQSVTKSSQEHNPNRDKDMHLPHDHDPHSGDGPQAGGPQSNSGTARYIVKS